MGGDDKRGHFKGKCVVQATAYSRVCAGMSGRVCVYIFASLVCMQAILAEGEMLFLVFQ